MGLRGRRLLLGLLSLAAAGLAALYAFGNAVTLSINQTYHPESVVVLDHLAWALPAVVAVLALVSGVLFVLRSLRRDR